VGWKRTSEPAAKAAVPCAALICPVFSTVCAMSSTLPPKALIWPAFFQAGHGIAGEDQAAA